MSRCHCLAAVTDIPCICEPPDPDPGWLDRVLERARIEAEKLPKCLRDATFSMESDHVQ